MQTDYSRHIQLCKLVSLVGGLDENDVSYLCQHVHHNPYCIIASMSLWQACDEIHADIIPLPLWNGQWLDESGWFLVFCLHFVAYVAIGQKIGNVLLHPIPPEYLSKVFVHFCTPG